MIDILRRPLKTCLVVGKEWASIMTDFLETSNKEMARNLLEQYFCQYTNLNGYFIIQHLFQAGLDFEADNKQISLFASKIEPALEAAHDLIIREWVLFNGIRFEGKEGDAVEIKDPESGFEKIGTVLAVYKPRASALIQYRNRNDKTEFREFGAEDIIKIYKDGKPFDNSPRGGKVGFQTDEFTQAVAA